MRTPRACTALKRLNGEKRDDLLLLKIDPPIIGQRFGLGERNIDHVIVATRFEGTCLFRLHTGPRMFTLLVSLLPTRDRRPSGETRWNPLPWRKSTPRRKPHMVRAVAS